MQRCASVFTLLMLGSGVATGGVSKTAGSSSSVENGGGCRVGLSGRQDVLGASGAGWNFTSGFLDAGSRAVGDRARLACRGEREILKSGKYVCRGHSVLHNIHIKTTKLKGILKSDIFANKRHKRGAFVTCHLPHFEKSLEALKRAHATALLSRLS